MRRKWTAVLPTKTSTVSGRAMAPTTHPTASSAGEWVAFVRSLLERHYDPVYRRCGDFLNPVTRHEMENFDPATLDRTAAALVAAAA